MLSAAEASCNAGALGRAQAELDEAAAYRDDQRHLGLAQRVQGRIHHSLRQPAKATSALLGRSHQPRPVDIRLARDILSRPSWKPRSTAARARGRRESMWPTWARRFH